MVIIKWIFFLYVFFLLLDVSRSPFPAFAFAGYLYLLYRIQQLKNELEFQTTTLERKLRQTKDDLFKFKENFSLETDDTEAAKKPLEKTTTEKEISKKVTKPTDKRIPELLEVVRSKVEAQIETLSKPKKEAIEESKEPTESVESTNITKEKIADDKSHEEKELTDDKNSLTSQQEAQKVATVIEAPITKENDVSSAAFAEKQDSSAAKPTTSKVASQAKPKTPAKQKIDWEVFIGQQLLSYVGIVILVLGLAFLSAYSLAKLEAMGRVALGTFASLGFLVTGFKLEQKQRYRLFGRIMMGGGWAMLYFIAFGSYHIPVMKVIHDPIIGTFFLAGVAAFMVGHSLVYASQSLTGVALLLAYMTLFVTEVSLYTSVASLILAVLICVFSFSFRWYMMHLIGVVMIYSGYGVWVYLHGPKSLPADLGEYKIVSAILILFWVAFKIPDFSKPKPGEKSYFLPWIGITNILCLSIVRKISHVTFSTSGSPASAIYLGGIYLIIAEILRMRQRERLYLQDFTIAILLSMVGLWTTTPTYAATLSSWFILAVAICGYSIYRSSSYLKDLSTTVAGITTILALGGNYPQQVIQYLYRLFSGELFLDLPSSLPVKKEISFEMAGNLGLLGSTILLCMGILYFALAHRKKQKLVGQDRKRDVFLHCFATLTMIIAFSYNLLPFYCGLAWCSLGMSMFLYGLWRQEFYLRGLGHLVLIWSGISGQILSLTPTQAGILMATGAIFLYLDGFITFWFFGTKVPKTNRESLLEKIVTLIATLTAMVSLPELLLGYPGGEFILGFAWILLGAVVYQYGFMRREFYLRATSFFVILWPLLSAIAYLSDITNAGVTIFTGSTVIYLSGFITWRFAQRLEVSSIESLFEKVTTTIATLFTMFACALVFSPIVAKMACLLLGTLLFYYGVARGESFLRSTAYSIWLFIAIIASYGIWQGNHWGRILGEWSSSKDIYPLLTSILLFLSHGVLIHLVLPKATHALRRSEEKVLVTLGTVFTFILAWFSLPLMAIAIVYSLFSLIMIELGSIYQRSYMIQQSFIGVILSSFWFFSVNCSAGGTTMGIPRGVLGSLPVLGCWSYINWMSHTHKKLWQQGAITGLMSYLNFFGILSVLYFHYYFGGFSWGLYALCLLWVSTRVPNPRYGIQAFLVFIVITFQSSATAARSAGGMLEYINLYPSLIWVPATIFAAHFIGKQYQDLFQKEVTGRGQSLLRHANRCYGLLFCFLITFEITFLAKESYYSFAWGIEGLFLAAYGLLAHEKHMRRVALALFSLSVCKIVFYDIFSFSAEERIITFIGVGIAFLSISFLYNRLKEQVTDFLMKD